MICRSGTWLFYLVPDDFIVEIPPELLPGNGAGKRHYFWFGEVGMAAMLAGVFAVPAGIYLAGRADISLAFIGAAIIFLPLFVFMPKLIQRAMKADTDAVIDAFGKNEQVKKVFWILFVATVGLVLARVGDPAMAHEITTMITGIVP